MHLDINAVRHQIATVLQANPELEDDDVLRMDTIEGQTDTFELLRVLERKRRNAEKLAKVANEERKDIEAREARFWRREGAVRKLMFSLMDLAGIPKAELPEATLSIHKGRRAVRIIDETQLPEVYIRIKREPDKTEIGKALAAGDTVPGAVLSNAEPYLTIRI